jgi:hypothetical protein
MKGYEAAQRAYDAMLPPDHDDEEPDLIPAPPGEGTCAGCGEDYDADSMICECLMGPRIVDPDYQTPAERREAAAEARAEASYER